MLSDNVIEQLSADLDGNAVKSRAQAGMRLSYVEGHYCIRRANSIFGFGNWRRETKRMELISFEDDIVKTDKQGNPVMQKVPGQEEPGPVLGWRVAYLAQVRFSVRVGNAVLEQLQTEAEIDFPLKLADEWLPMDGTGFGESTTYISPGQAHEGAAKEAETDAMKRAMICWGDQFGLALYDRDQEHVEGTVSGGGNGQRRSSGGGGSSSEQGGACPECGKTMYLRDGKNGKFWGCAGYKDGCKQTFNAGEAPWEQQQEQGPPPVDPGPEDPFGDEGAGGGENMVHVVTDKASWNRFCGAVERWSEDGEAQKKFYMEMSERVWGGPVSPEKLTSEQWQRLHDEAMDLLLEEAEREGQAAQ